MKNIGQYNQDLSVPRKKDIDSLETRVKTNEDNIAMAESDIEGLNTDVGTLKTDVSNVKTTLSYKQNKYMQATNVFLTADSDMAISADNPKASMPPVYYRTGLGGNIKLNSFAVDSNQVQLTAGYTTTGDAAYQAAQLTLSEGKATFQKLNYSGEGDTKQPLTLSGVADATNTNDAVNLGQLNKVKNSIPDSSDFVKTTGGMVTGPLYLLGGTGPLNVKNGSVTLNEGYSIGYGDGNYNFTQISGNFQISKGDSGQGVYIASETDGTNGSLRMDVNNDSQNASTHMTIASNGVISLSASAKDSSSGSLMVNNVRVTGVADGTADKDAVNLSQLKQYSVLSGTITVSNITGNFAGETDMLLFAIRCSGDITSVKDTNGKSQEYAELLYINGNDSMFGSPSFSYDTATKKITLSFIGTYKTAPTTLELKCLFRV